MTTERREGELPDDDQKPLTPEEYPDPDEQEEFIDEDVSPWPGWYRPAVIIAGLLFTLAMVAPGVLRILAFDTDEPPSAEERLRGNTALIFTAAVFEQRSVDLAMNVTVGSLEREIELLVADLERREAGALGSTNITLVGANCAGLDERSEQCFEVTVDSAGGLPLMRVRFGISFVAGSPRIIDIIRSGTAV